MNQKIVEYLLSDTECLNTFEVRRNHDCTEWTLPNGTNIFEHQMYNSGAIDRKTYVRWQTEFMEDTPKNRQKIKEYGGYILDYANCGRIESEGYIIGDWNVGEYDYLDEYSNECDSLYYKQFEKIWDYSNAD